MSPLRFYGHPPPGIDDVSLPGRLIIVEGTDGVGRSTQIALLKEWLEDSGYAVLDTGLTRSQLAGPGIKRAKEGNTLDPITLNLFYATDFWDRLERDILPALRAGMVALADRYTFSLIVRAVVRGVSAEWMENLYGFAPVPDGIIYLDIDVDHLLPRVLASTGFDYWESGQDFLPGADVYESFVDYQEKVLAEFRRQAVGHRFRVVDARRGVAEVFADVRAGVASVIETMGREDGANGPPLATLSAERAIAGSHAPVRAPKHEAVQRPPSSART